MSENNQKCIKYNLIKEILVKYEPEITQWLKEKQYKYKILEIKDLAPYQTKEEIEEDVPLVYIDPILFHKLDKIADFIGDDIHTFAEMLLKNPIEEFENDPYHMLTLWLHEKDLIQKIFNK